MPMRCGRGIGNGSFRLQPGANHCAAHGTGGNPDARMAAYPFHLASVCQGVHIEDIMVFRKPYRGPDGRSIPFDTLQGKISLPHKGNKALARHGTPCMVDAVGTLACIIVPEMRRPSGQPIAVGGRYGGAHCHKSLRPSVRGQARPGR
jgi:hypothetical protein